MMESKRGKVAINKQVGDGKKQEMMKLLSKLNRFSNNVKSQLKIYYKTK